MHHEVECCVVGLGGMGSAALYYASQGSQSVLGVEQFAGAHERGSSHGESRLYRQIYFEHPNYVPLLQRALTNWRALEEETDQTLYEQTGVLIFVPEEGSEILPGLQASAHTHKLDLQMLTRADLPSSVFALPDGFVGAWEPLAGFLYVERCVKAHLDAAQARGARLLDHCPIQQINYQSGRFRLQSPEHTITCQKLIVTAGAWLPHLLPELSLPLQAHLVTQSWVPPGPGMTLAEGMPCYGYEFPGEGFFYGVPAASPRGVKLALHAPGAQLSHPKDKTQHDISQALIKKIAKRIFPQIDPTPRETARCLYTMSPDGHFILDQAYDGQLTYLSGMSGHGFKFASVMGEILASLALQGQTDHPIEFLKMSRF